MPIYEYRCNTCRRPFSIFVRSLSAEASATCPRCGGSDVRRLISRFSVLHSDESRAEQLMDSADLADIDENDPRSVARWARRMSNELGEDVGPEFNEIVDRLEAGESPESIEQTMGDLGEMGDMGTPPTGGDEDL
jgi:putative FmdB family regulatory protein